MSISILLVEDDPEWADALKKMYNEILRESDPKTIRADSVEQGIRLLEDFRFDLLSCDINLSNGHSMSGDGRTVIRKASQAQVSGVICITALQHDKKIHVVVPKEELQDLRLRIHDWLERLFPGQNRYFPKQKGLAVPAQIQKIRKGLRKRTILSLAGRENIFLRSGDYWEVSFKGKQAHIEDKAGMKAIQHLLSHPGENMSFYALLEVETSSYKTTPEDNIYIKEDEAIGVVGPHGKSIKSSVKSDIENIEWIDSEIKRKKKKINNIRKSINDQEQDNMQREIQKLEDDIARYKETRQVLTESKETAQAKQIRDRVDRRIRRSRARIGKYLPDLKDHLDSCIEKPGDGTMVYLPAEPISWYA